MATARMLFDLSCLSKRQEGCGNGSRFLNFYRLSITSFRQREAVSATILGLSEVFSIPHLLK